MTATIQILGSTKALATQLAQRVGCRVDDKDSRYGWDYSLLIETATDKQVGIIDRYVNPDRPLTVTFNICEMTEKAALELLRLARKFGK